MKIVITGGEGDIAKAIAKKIKGKVYLPSKEELNVILLQKVKNYFAEIKPDILINCAGFISPGLIKNSDVLKWEKHIAVNLIGAYYCARAVLNNNTKIIIINIASSAGLKGRAGWSAYCASKAGLISLTQSLADEGVNAYCISPKRTATKMRKALFPKEDQKKLDKPEDVANVVADILAGKHKKGGNVCL